MTRRLDLAFALAMGWALLAASKANAQQPVDFVRDVRPILSNHCFACHGPDAEGRKAKLDLSTPGSARKVLAPSDLDASELWQRIRDEDDPMPPADAHNPLNDAQIATLRQWILAGASYEPHWAFVDPRVEDPPAVSDSGWAADPFDRYLQASWQQAGLRVAEDADAATLLRRLSYDLTGLPPTIAQLDAFDGDQASYDAAVDRLLASPHYGERMAMLWLDLVRYADTVGYHGDQDHRAWPYRDYVIAAFNRNLPFDQFTIEQLAGDLLPESNQQQLVATTYNRLLQTTHEGGLQLGEYREIYQADRVRNVSAVWMGATVGCAQCHDHKFDPYTQRDFHALGAFFADIDDEEHLRNPYGNLNTLPTNRVPEMAVYSDAARTEHDRLTAQIADATSNLERTIATLPQRRIAWRKARLADLATDATRERTWIDDSLPAAGKRQGRWQFARKRGIKPHSGKAYRTQQSQGLVQHYTTEVKEPLRIEGGERFFAWVQLDVANPPSALMLQFDAKNGGWEHRAVWGSDDINYGRRRQSWNGYRRQGALPTAGKWVRLSIELAQLGLAPGDVVRGVAYTQFGGVVHWDRSGVVQGAVPRDVAIALQTSEPTEEQQLAIARHHRRTDDAVRAADAALATLREQQQRHDAAQPRTMVTRALAKPRQMRMRPRGNWLDDSGELVQPAIPAFLGKLATSGDANRLDLARWLVARDGHGLRTARVFVNRIWAMLFGAGLCPSTEDFGGQGRPPTYPKLLDALAVSFVESQWDVKALIARLVRTRAYRLSSIASPEALAADPFNERFARQSRHRLPAEMIRDTALTLGGLLQTSPIGGPSVRPPQPPGYYRHLNFPTRRYQPDRDARQWRRGVYVHWQRQFLHPMLRAFDAPTREECTTARPISNTPTAALTLLNDPTFVEAARAFAQRVRTTDDGDAATSNDNRRLRRAFRQATARQPRDAEVDTLRALLEASRAHFRDHPDDAHRLLQIGDAPRDQRLDVIEHAAWTQTARAILNLHETITRG